MQDRSADYAALAAHLNPDDPGDGAARSMPPSSPISVPDAGPATTDSSCGTSACCSC
ncbi:hypothetical protein ACFSTI_34535 [Rhizorhabdus histidinilytica]